jgi:AcrR family transcriptional regulator
MKKTKQNNIKKYGGLYAGQRVDIRRKKLIQAGLESFGTLGYTKTTIKAICKISGLTERYFYESFNNKEELLGCVYQTIVDEITENAMNYLIKPSLKPKEIIEGAFGEYLGALWKDQRRARVLYFEVLGVSPEIDKKYRSAQDRMVDLVSFLISKIRPEIKRESLNATIIPTGLAGAIIFMAERWVLDNYKTPLDDIVRQAVIIFESFEKLLKIETDLLDKLQDSN